MFFRKNRVFFKYCGKPGSTGQSTDGSIIRHIRCADRRTKVINTHSEYVILKAFQRQKLLHERTSALRYTCTRALPVLFVT